VKEITPIAVSAASRGIEESAWLFPARGGHLRHR